MVKKYSADFETTTDPNDCRVWAWGCMEIYDEGTFLYDNNLDSFMSLAEKQGGIYYFHNGGKFDYEFIYYWLFKHGFSYVEDRKLASTKTFTTLISDKGRFYSMTIYFYKNGHKTRKAVFRDSLNIFNFSVEDIAKGFKLKDCKLKIDYTEFREIGHKITEHELVYLHGDVTIIAQALNYMFNEGFEKITIGSNALAKYKEIAGSNFRTWFPVPNYDTDVRKSYKGAFTFLNPEFAGKEIGYGFVLDVNSLYPFVMRNNLYPYGEPIYYTGNYKKDELYPLFIQNVTLEFKLKEHKLPCIQIKNNLSYCPTDYLSESEGEVNLTLTSVDWQMIQEQYDVYNVTYHGGYKFKAGKDFFTEYIDYWVNEKITAKLEGNSAMYLIAKLFLNSLYGKFATNPIVGSKGVAISEDKIIYPQQPDEYKEPIYIPVGSFITAYARQYTISTAQKIEDNYFAGKSKIRFIYADTDSLHCFSPDLTLPDYIDIDNTRLGAWKNELIFEKGKYLHSKCYIELGVEPHFGNLNNFDFNFKANYIKEELEKEREKAKQEAIEKDEKEKNIIKITIAGLPQRCHDQVTFNNFNLDTEYNNKLRPSHVKGGIVLQETTFKIRKK